MVARRRKAEKMATHIDNYNNSRLLVCEMLIRDGIGAGCVYLCRLFAMREGGFFIVDSWGWSMPDQSFACGQSNMGLTLSVDEGLLLARLCKNVTIAYLLRSRC